MTDIPIQSLPADMQNLNAAGSYIQHIRPDWPDFMTGSFRPPYFTGRRSDWPGHSSGFSARNELTCWTTAFSIAVDYPRYPQEQGNDLP